MNALVTIGTETLTPAVFSTEGGIDALLAKIEAEVRAVATDISTPAGRKAVASLAFKVARSKTAFDAMGKDLASEWKLKAKAIDTERARVWDRLEELQAEVRKPLDEYETAEATRIADHQAALQAVIDLGTFAADMPASAEVITAIQALEGLPDRDWQELKQKAATARSETFAKLQALKSASLAREAEVAELERLRAEQAVREQQERDARIAAEAAAAATQEAERRAAAEAARIAEEVAARELQAARERAETIANAQRAEREAAEALAKSESDRVAAETAAREAEARAERDRIAAAEQAEADRLAAIDAERQRVADEAAAEAAAAAKREADKEHKKAINNEAKAALIAAGLSEMDSIKAVTAIAKGDVPNVKISY
jgi:hypothetical protein